MIQRFFFVLILSFVFPLWAYGQDIPGNNQGKPAEGTSKVLEEAKKKLQQITRINSQIQQANQKLRYLQFYIKRSQGTPQAEQYQKQYQQIFQNIVTYQRIIKELLEEAKKSTEGLLPANKEAYKVRAQIFSLEGNYEKAAEDFAEYLKHDPSYKAAYYHIGECRLKMMDWEEAWKNFTKAEELDYVPDKCQSQKAVILFYQEKYDEAIVLYQKILAQHKANPQVSKSIQNQINVVETYKKLKIKEEELIKKEEAAKDLPQVKLVTSKGEMVVELFENEAPNTVANFISLVEKKLVSFKSSGM